MPVKTQTDKSYIYTLADGSQYTEKMAKDLVHLYQTGKINTDNETIQALSEVNAIVPYLDSYSPTLTADQHMSYFRELGIDGYWEEDDESSNYNDEQADKVTQLATKLNSISPKNQQRRERIKRQYAQKLKEINKKNKSKQT